MLREEMLFSLLVAFVGVGIATMEAMHQQRAAVRLARSYSGRFTLLVLIPVLCVILVSYCNVYFRRIIRKAQSEYLFSLIGINIVSCLLNSAR